MEKCRKELDLPAVWCSGPLEGFAVDRNGVSRSDDGCKPAGNGRVYRLAVESLEETSDGRFTGSLIDISSWLFPASQPFEHLLVASFSPLGNGVEALGSAEDSTDGDGQNGQSVVANAARHARVGNGEQSFVEQIAVFFREFHCGQPGFERCLEAWVGEPQDGVFVQRPDKDGFDTSVMSVHIVVLCESSGVSEKGPTGGSVTGASIELGIDECFGEQNGVSVSFPPIVRQTPDV